MSDPSMGRGPNLQRRENFDRVSPLPLLPLDYPSIPLVLATTIFCSPLVICLSSLVLRHTIAHPPVVPHRSRRSRGGILVRSRSRQVVVEIAVLFFFDWFLRIGEGPRNFPESSGMTKASPLTNSRLLSSSWMADTLTAMPSPQ